MSALLVALVVALAPQSIGDPSLDTRAPDAVVVLTEAADVAALSGQWRYSDARLVEVQYFQAGEDGQPGAVPSTTYDYEPHAGVRDFDDSQWAQLAPSELSRRRGPGKISFNWYRFRFTVPERIGNFDTRGSTVQLEISVDDYAEIWIDGELPRRFSQSGGSVVAGWNAPNVCTVARDVVPGQEIQLAIFGINGPISSAPSNYIYVRSAALTFQRGIEGPLAIEPREVNVEVERLDPRIDRLVPLNTKLFKLAEGFVFTEGPVWSKRGSLLFSDPNANRIYEYDAQGALSVFRERSGYAGDDIAEYRQPGSNGLAFDREGRLVSCEHGNHRITRLEADGSLTVLADSYQGKRLNSPNDLVVRSDGAIYFTDPPFGLPRFHEDARRELTVSGVYRIADGDVRLVSSDLEGPNGLAFSPDERFLYVANWDPAKKVVMRYRVGDDGGLEEGAVFFDMTSAPGMESLDGIEVDELGHLYVSGPGGIWVLAPDGLHLGTIRGPRLAANFAWGGADGRTLYLTARDGLYKLPLLVGGKRP